MDERFLALPSAAGRRAVSATSGSTCCSRRAPSTSRRSRRERLGPRRREADHRGGRRPPHRPTGADRTDGGNASPRTACSTRSWRCAGASAHGLDRRPRRSGRARRRRARRRAGRSRSADRRPAVAAPPRRRRRRARAGSPSGARARTFRRSRERSQPAISSASALGPVTDELLAPSGSPASGPRAAPASRASGPRRCRRRRSGRRAPPAGVGVRQAAPLRRVDDEPVADVDELVELRRSPRRLPRQRQNIGRSEIRSGCDDRRRHPRALAAQAQLDHLGADLAGDALQREAADRHGHVDAVGASPARAGAGSCATGAAPRARRASACAAAAHFGRRPGDVGHHARAQVGQRRPPPRAARSSASCALDLSETIAISGPHQWRRQLRPSRWSSSSAAAGPHVPAS